MKIVFLTNFINHHQVHLADEFYNLLGDNYKFIATMAMPQWLIDSGYPQIERPYLINAYRSSVEIDEAMKIAYEADVAIIGSAPESFVKKRLEANKLTFHYSERWFKEGYKSLISPWFWKSLYINHLKYRNCRSYMLCASAYTAKDVNLVGAYKNKCFKWGYFTKVEKLDTNQLSENLKQNDNYIHIMWCARFLKLKHPELPVKLAARLKSKGYRFIIDMFGSGEEFEATKNLARKLNVDDCVNFCGNKSNDEILAEMRQHDVFLFTSDRNEGWGAVLNEAMSCGCAVVASDQIGSVPFLIEDKVNGLIFRSESLPSLEEKVRYLLDNPEKIIQFSQNAYKTMSNVWSPKNAVSSFFYLLNSFDGQKFLKIPKSGPCSIAERLI